MVPWRRTVTVAALAGLLVVGGLSAAGAERPRAACARFDELVEKLAGRGTEAMLAAKTLADLGDRRAVPHLLTMARAKGYSLRLAAITALGRLGDRRATDGVIAALNADDAHMRAAAAEALGRIGDRKATRSLRRLLDDEAIATRLAAVRALGALGDPQAVRALALMLTAEASEMRIASARALGMIGQRRAEPALAQALTDADLRVRRASLAAIRALGPDTPAKTPGAIEPLTGLLKHRYPQIRAYAVGKLGQSGNPGAVALLTGALDDRSPDVFFGASLWLGRLGGDRAITALIGVIETTDSPRRWTSAAAGLAQAKAAPAVPALIEHMMSRRFDVDVLQAGLVALGGIGDTSALAPLRKLQATSPKARLCQKTLVGVMARLGDPASWTVAMNAAKAPAAASRRQAAVWLGYTQAPRAVAPLITLLSDPHPDVRAMAATALGNIPHPGPAARTALSAALKDTARAVRQAAMAALERIILTPPPATGDNVPCW